MTTISIMGAGSWGTALAQMAARNGHKVKLWAREAEVVVGIQNERRNPVFLSDIQLSENIWATKDPIIALNDTDLVLMVIPTQFIRSFVQETKGYFPQTIPIISCAKGIEVASLKTPTQILAEELTGASQYLGVLSGPSFALEVAQNHPTNVAVAAKEKKVANGVQKLLAQKTFRIYTTTDTIGVEIGAACKNVMAVAAGISSGAGYGANTQAALISRGIAEITRLAVAMGANPLTLLGLAGIGDLILTCSGDLSRNRSLGKMIGLGKTPKEYFSHSKMVAEGYHSSKSIHELARQKKVDCPIIEQVYQVLHEELPVNSAISSLLARDFKEEVCEEYNYRLPA